MTGSQKNPGDLSLISLGAFASETPVLGSSKVRLLHTSHYAEAGSLEMHIWIQRTVRNTRENPVVARVSMMDGPWVYIFLCFLLGSEKSS
jgi:hypothetical protein